MKMCKTFKILSGISQKRWREEKKKREKQISKTSKMEVLKILILVLRPFENSFATLNQRHFSSTGLRLSSRGTQIVFSHSLNFKSVIHGAQTAVSTNQYADHFIPLRSLYAIDTPHTQIRTVPGKWTIPSHLGTIWDAPESIILTGD